MNDTNSMSTIRPTTDNRSHESRRRRRGWLIVGAAMLCLSAMLCSTTAAANEPPPRDAFDGPFIGLEVGSLNYFGGALIGSVDVLAQESKIVTAAFAGYRKQIANGRLLLGFRLHYGVTDGDLRFTDPDIDLDIQYENDSEVGYLVEVGTVLRTKRPLALFVYGGETRRDFDVTITLPFGIFTQNDEQTFARFGAGIELRLRRALNLRATVGRTDVDFGDLETNINVEFKTDVVVGLTYQF